MLSYEIVNLQAFTGAVKKAAAAVSDLRPVFPQILEDFYRSEKSIFEASGPRKYPPISEHYARQKERRYGFRYPLLLAAGPLAASVTSSSAPGAVVTMTETALTVGTSIPEGQYHQLPGARSKIPYRPFLFIGPESEFADADQAGRAMRWVGFLDAYVKAKARESGMAN